MYIVLQSSPMGISQTVTQPDAGFFVMRDVDASSDTMSSFPTLVDFVTPRLGERALQLSLDAGSYRIIPYSPGCKLRKRRAEPEYEPVCCKGSSGTYDLTPKAVQVRPSLVSGRKTVDWWALEAASVLP